MGFLLSEFFAVRTFCWEEGIANAFIEQFFIVTGIDFEGALKDFGNFFLDIFGARKEVYTNIFNS